MIETERKKVHASLVDQTAAKAGVDLQEAAIRGHLRYEEIADMVLRCMDCASPGQCARSLAHASDTTSSLPDYCRNGAMFERLRKVSQ